METAIKILKRELRYYGQNATISGNGTIQEKEMMTAINELEEAIKHLEATPTINTNTESNLHLHPVSEPLIIDDLTITTLLFDECWFEFKMSGDQDICAVIKTKEAKQIIEHLTNGINDS